MLCTGMCLLGPRAEMDIAIAKSWPCKCKARFYLLIFSVHRALEIVLIYLVLSSSSYFLAYPPTLFFSIVTNVWIKLFSTKVFLFVYFVTFASLFLIHSGRCRTFYLWSTLSFWSLFPCEYRERPTKVHFSKISCVETRKPGWNFLKWSIRPRFEFVILLGDKMEQVTW